MSDNEQLQYQAEVKERLQKLETQMVEMDKQRKEIIKNRLDSIHRCANAILLLVGSPGVTMSVQEIREHLKALKELLK